MSLIALLHVLASKLNLDRAKAPEVWEKFVLSYRLEWQQDSKDPQKRTPRLFPTSDKNKAKQAHGKR